MICHRSGESACLVRARRHPVVHLSGRPHEYGFCRWEGPEGLNVPEWEFNSEEEFLNTKLFRGRSILERLEEAMCYDP